MPLLCYCLKTLIGGSVLLHSNFTCVDVPDSPETKLFQEIMGPDLLLTQVQ